MAIPGVTLYPYRRDEGQDRFFRSFVGFLDRRRQERRRDRLQAENVAVLEGVNDLHDLLIEEEGEWKAEGLTAPQIGQKFDALSGRFTGGFNKRQRAEYEKQTLAFKTNLVERAAARDEKKAKYELGRSMARSARELRGRMGEQRRAIFGGGPGAGAAWEGYQQSVVELDKLNEAMGGNPGAGMQQGMEEFVRGYFQHAVNAGRFHVVQAAMYAGKDFLFEGSDVRVQDLVGRDKRHELEQQALTAVGRRQTAAAERRRAANARTKALEGEAKDEGEVMLAQGGSADLVQSHLVEKYGVSIGARMFSDALMEHNRRTDALDEFAADQPDYQEVVAGFEEQIGMTFDQASLDEMEMSVNAAGRSGAIAVNTTQKALLEKINDQRVKAAEADVEELERSFQENAVKPHLGSGLQLDPWFGDLGGDQGKRARKAFLSAVPWMREYLGAEATADQQRAIGNAVALQIRLEMKKSDEAGTDTRGRVLTERTKTAFFRLRESGAGADATDMETMRILDVTGELEAMIGYDEHGVYSPQETAAKLRRLGVKNAGEWMGRIRDEIDVGREIRGAFAGRGKAGGAGR